MPIHQDPKQQLSKIHTQQEPPRRHVDFRGLSQDRFSTEYYDGPLPASLMDDVSPQTEKESRVSNKGEAICSDRAELIERIKRGESPTWIPNQAVSRR